MDAQNAILELSMGYTVPRCLHAIAELGVADALGDVPQSASELAAKTGTNADALRRAMRLLAAYDVFEAEGEKFRHTAASRLLRTDDPQSMRAFVRSMGCEIDWKSFELLEHTIQTGQPAAERGVTRRLLGVLSKHPKVGETFDQAMIALRMG